MTTKIGASLTGIALLIALVTHTLGQTGAPRQPSWLEPRNPNRLEWLALEKQANEGDVEFGEDGVTVNFYLGPDSYRTGEILCDLAYLSGTQARMVQTIEEGIQGRFEAQRRVDPWARVKIIKKVARP